MVLPGVGFWLQCRHARHLATAASLLVLSRHDRGIATGPAADLFRVLAIHHPG